MANGKMLQQKNDSEPNIKSQRTFEKWSHHKKKAINAWAGINIQHVSDSLSTATNFTTEACCKI